MSKKSESFGRKRAQEIRCQVKKEYDEKVQELERQVQLLREMVVKQDKQIRALKRENLRLGWAEDLMRRSFHE